MTTKNQDAVRAKWGDITIKPSKPAGMSDHAYELSIANSQKRFDADMAEAIRKDAWIDGEPERERERQESERRQKEYARSDARRIAHMNCRIPPRHMATTPDQAGAWGVATTNLVNGWKENAGLMIAIIGPRGTGKTQAAVELLKASCNEGIASRYCKAMDIFLTIKATFAQKNGDEITALKEFSKPAVLVIDEMQVRSESEWENNVLTHIVDERYSNGLATIIISNLTHEAFRKNVGESIYSRFTEQGGIVTYDAVNFRASAMARPAPETIVQLPEPRKKLRQEDLI